MTHRATTLALSTLASLTLVACAWLPGGNQGQAALSLPPVPHPADNPFSEAKATLGRQLFVDTRLSGSGKMACQSCHYRDLGWTDAKALSVRDDGKTNTRHTPSLYNVGHQTTWYWDGRATSLEGQVTAAWKAQTGADPIKVAATLNGIPAYRQQFQAAFGADATPENIAKALATFLRTLNSDDAPWDRHAAGQAGQVSREAIEGQALFAGKGGCNNCHTAPYYGNSTFFNVGLEHGKDKADPGRFNVTKNEADRGAFKTPTLRASQLSGPYFHDGSVRTLREAVAYMASGGKPDPNKSPLLQPTGLTDAEIDKIVAFLHTLTSTETWVQPTVPQ